MFRLEPEPGVTIVRRQFLRLSAGALGILLGGCAPRRPPPAPVTPITWDEFSGELAPRAEALLAQKMTEDAYVAEIVERLRRVDPKLIPPKKDLPRTKIFQVVEFGLTEGSGFRYHDHRRYNGVIFVLDGAVRCRNFDVVGPNRMPPAGEKLRIRETAGGVRRTGEASTLTTTRDNIHDVRGAEGGCRLLDIFTWMGKNPRSVYMDVDETPVEPGVFEGSFTS